MHGPLTLTFNLWMQVVTAVVVAGSYVAEDGTTVYVAENGTDVYVTEA